MALLISSDFIEIKTKIDVRVTRARFFTIIFSSLFSANDREGVVRSLEDSVKLSISTLSTQ